MNHRNEWASEGELNVVGEPEQILRYQKSAYGGTYSIGRQALCAERTVVCRRGCMASSRVAPQEILLLSRH